MIINVGDSGGGIIVQSTEPIGDDTMLWIDTAHYGVAKYWDETANNGDGAWIPVAAVWS